MMNSGNDFDDLNKFVVIFHSFLLLHCFEKSVPFCFFVLINIVSLLLLKEK